MTGRRIVPMGCASAARAVAACALIAAASACASLGGGQAPSLARADTLLSIGCHACLDEAVQIYERAIARRPGGRHARERLEVGYALMAFRERELGLPRSGARQRAIGTPAGWALPVEVFQQVLDALDDEHDPRNADSMAVTEAIAAVAELVASPASRNLAAAYALVTLSCSTSPTAALPSPAGARWLSEMGEQHLVLRYAELRCSSSMTAEDLDALIRADRRFGEAHYVAAVGELQHGRVLSAYEQLRRARAALPASSHIAIALANVNLALTRFDEALELYDAALDSGERRPAALLGRAKALTYLDRHSEAIELLDVLLEDTEWMPGEKYYWRAWNLYRLSRYTAARRDVLRALESWAAAHVEQLAGLTALALGRHGEARVHFVQALGLDADDCESQLYLAQLDSHARAWANALDGSSAAAGCFTRVLADRQGRTPEDETPEAATREVHRLERWRASSIYSAAISAKVLGRRELAIEYATRLLDDTELGGLARAFIYDIDVPASPHHPSLIGPTPAAPRPGS